MKYYVIYDSYRPFHNCWEKRVSEKETLEQAKIEAEILENNEWAKAITIAKKVK